MSSKNNNSDSESDDTDIREEDKNDGSNTDMSV
jgi:hypothetical protein